MNLLEQYIEEVIEIKPYEEEWTKKYDKKFFEIELISNCYGCREKRKKIWSEGEMKKNIEQGFYWG